MDSFRPQRSPDANRFIGPLSQPERFDAAAAGVDDLDVGDIFSTEFDASDLNHPVPNPRYSASCGPGTNPTPGPSRFGHRLILERNLGILAVLSEEDCRYPLIQRNSSSYSSPSSSARMIPAIPKPKAEYVLSVKGGKIHHQSAPMNVPHMPLKASRFSSERDREARGRVEIEEEEMLPPHEIVARAPHMHSPRTTFSMLEGVGRTLKGRDLRRVRNAVWRQTGFQD